MNSLQSLWNQRKRESVPHGTLRLFVLGGMTFLVCWQLAVLFGAPHRTQIALGLNGFVFHVLFGKAYALLPAHFETTLHWNRAPDVHFVLATIGVLALAGDPIVSLSKTLAQIGALSWGMGVIIFCGTMLATIRTNLTGASTGTGEFNQQRHRIDRIANGVVPIALGYLLLGAYETVALATPLPAVIAVFPHQVSHVLAVGTATLLLFAVGARILPRFFVVHPPVWLVIVLLSSGVLGPMLLVLGMGLPLPLGVGAIVQTVALVAYAGLISILFANTNRRRVGFIGIGIGALFGLVAVGLGLLLAFNSSLPGILPTHQRITLLGFLGFSIIGVALQFYPPGAGSSPGVSDSTAVIGFAVILLGLVIEVFGTVLTESTVTRAGTILVLGGTFLVWYLLTALTVERGLW